jgi:carbonic anhydrase
MLTFTDSDIRSKIEETIGEKADHIAFLPFKDLKQSVLDDIAILRKNSLLLDVPITGYIYQVETGKLVRVVA